MIIIYYNMSDIKNGTYMLLNFIIFVAIYIFILIYQFRFNTPSTYYISMFIDIIFCIYLIIFSSSQLSQHDTLISTISFLVIFGFVILRLISTIVFPFYFLKVERKRLENKCKWDDVTTKITKLMKLNKISYVFSSVSILLLLIMILFWNNEINDNIGYAAGFGMNNKSYITFFLLAINVVFSVMNAYFSLKFRSVVGRTTICQSAHTKNEL